MERSEAELERQKYEGGFGVTGPDDTEDSHESQPAIQDSQALRVTGHIKWFDPAKGFGFVVSDAGGPDILLHANVLRNYGQSSVADGVGIEVEAQKTPRGIQAIQVLSIDPVEAQPVAGLEDFDGLSEDAISDIDPVPVRVKWFDKVKGFGFANAFGADDDIFIHVEVLRRSGLADLQPGEAICLRVINGKRGLMAVKVESWESAVG